MEIVYRDWSFFQIIRMRRTGDFLIQRLKNVIEPPTGYEKIGWVRITPMFGVATDEKPFVILMGERGKYQTYDPEHIYIIPRILA